MSMEYYATLGDPCAKREVLDKLFRAGMTGIRVNLSHTSLAKCAPLLEEGYWPAARAAGRPDAHLILDLQGPELRVGELPRPILLREGEELSRWEAGLLFPSRQDFARLWRFLEHNCVGGWMEAGPALLRQAARQPDGRCAYGRTLVCLHVMGDRGLIRVERDQLHLCRPENKVDLEQAAMMRQLRLFLQEE